MASANQPLILVVEDDPAIANIICDVLTEEGYRCVTAKSVAGALQLLENVTPALITLDLGLPGVGGGILLHRLRANVLTSAIPVVIISAERVIETQLRAASQAVIAKPFGIDQLIATVRHVLDAGAGEQAQDLGGGAGWQHPSHSRAPGLAQHPAMDSGDPSMGASD